MEERKSTNKNWIYFFVWLAILVVMMWDINGFTRKFFWLALPGVFTYFVKSMDLIDANTPT
ncbi:MAG: hypothetical protein H7101_05765 [Deinococcales bacterium]|nr:hypothetical protein [Chitinophagaceae bacterium]